MSKEKKYVQSPDALLTEGDGDGVFLQLQSEKYFTLNKVGMDVYKAILNNDNQEEIIRKITQKYDVDKDTAAKDIKKITNDLVSKKIIIESSN